MDTLNQAGVSEQVQSFARLPPVAWAISWRPAKTGIFMAERSGLMRPILPGTQRAALGSISAIPGLEFAGFAGLQVEAVRPFLAFVEDQPVKVVGQMAKGQFCLSASQADGADEQVDPVLLMREDMFNMSADRGFGGIGPRGWDP
ncbi:MAG: hypothetical protein QM690_18480 [Sphingobium sp.]